MLDASTRLRNAIVQGSLSITKRLLSRFPELWLNIDPNNDGWSNLHYAAYHGHYLICFHLISMMNKYKREIPGYGHICDIDLVAFSNLTVYHMPIKNHYSQTLHYLLQAFSGSKWLDQKGGPDMRTPLHCCCASDFIEGLNLFLEFGADWSAQDSNGETCLHICFSVGNSACIQEFVKGIATRKTIILLNDYDEDVSTSKEEGGPSLSELLQAVNEELHKLESIKNNRGFIAMDQAFSDLIVSQYKSQKHAWIASCIESELTLRESALSIVSSYNVTGGSVSGRPRLLSVSSSVTSSLLHIGKAVSRSSLESETPPPLPTSGVSLNDVLVPHVAREAFGLSKTSEVKSAGRKHLSSLPNSSQPENVVAQVVHEKIPQMRKHSKSLGYAYRTSPNQLRTPKLQQTPVIPPISPHPLEFSRTQSLKSITISPLARHNKRSNVVGLTEEPELDTSVTLSDSSVASNRSSAAATPVSTKPIAQQFFSPLNKPRRRSLSVTCASGETPRLLNEDDGLGSKTNSTKQFNFPFFKRNLSTPAFCAESSSSESISPNKLSRRPSTGDGGSKPTLQLIIPSGSTSLSKPKILTLSPSSASIASDEAFESSPSTLTPYKIKPMFPRNIPTRVDSILESSEEASLPRVSESVHDISFTRIRGDVHS